MARELGERAIKLTGSQKEEEGGSWWPNPERPDFNLHNNFVSNNGHPGHLFKGCNVNLMGKKLIQFPQNFFNSINVMGFNG